MLIVYALTIIFAAYDILLVPFVVFKRTQQHRVYWMEICFSIGVIMLLLGHVIVSVVQKNNHWYGTPLTLVSCILIAMVSRSIIGKTK